MTVYGNYNVTAYKSCIQIFTVHPPTLSGLAANMPYQYSQVLQKSGRRGARFWTATQPAVCSIVWPHPYMYHKVKQQCIYYKQCSVCLFNYGCQLASSLFPHICLPLCQLFSSFPLLQHYGFKSILIDNVLLYISDFTKQVLPSPCKTFIL